MEAGVAGFGSELNGSAMLPDDALDGVQAQSGAFAHAFGGEKRLEDVRLDFGGNSRAVVRDFDHGATVLGESSDAQLTGSAQTLL